jgi:hypothetical protein
MNLKESWLTVLKDDAWACRGMCINTVDQKIIIYQKIPLGQ